MFKLKKIELLGFKSFADRTRLEFSEGTVAIVGPNGCGKSNVSDAVSWVLGEQSARLLRGERMADLIFNGTGKRPPTGMAEVSVTLIDPEYVEADAASAATPVHFPGAPSLQNAHATEVALAPDGESAEAHATEDGAMREADARPLPLRNRSGEITVTRRLFRSGESEYLINGEGCRLRDIQDLFMGTGLGPDSYAIIEQGRIGQILSSKPSDRRAIIEEAAGVSKFKTRKRLAEAKLESSKANLARITDILLEVTKQMNSLKRQASKARRHRELSGEVRGKLRMVLAARLLALENECGRLDGELAAVQGECARAAQQLETLELEEKTGRLYSEQAEGGLTELRQSIAQRDLECERLNSRIEQVRQHSMALQTRAGEAVIESAQLQGELAHLEEEAGAHAQQAQQVRQDWQSARDLAARLLSQREQLTAEFANKEGELESCRQELLGTVSRAADLRNQLTKGEEAGLALERQLARLFSERGSAEQEHQRLLADSGALGLDHASESSALARLSGSAADTAEALRNARDEATCRETELEQLRQEFSAAAARRQALEESLTRHAYSTETVRKLLSEPIPLNGHPFRPLGLLADFLEVSPGYEEAVEEFLKEALEYVVVECHEQARSGIALLKSEGFGRSTFFVTRWPSNGSGNGHEPALEGSDFRRSASGSSETTAAVGGPSAAGDVAGPEPTCPGPSPVSGNSSAEVPPAGSSNGLSKLAEVSASLKDLVRFEAKLGLNGAVALPTLASAYLVEDAATAERLAAAYPQGHFLTPSGEHYHHRLVAGGRGASAGPLALRRDFRALERRTAALKTDLGRAETRVAEIVERAKTLEEHLRHLTAARLEAEKKVLLADEKLRQIRETLERSTQRQNLLHREISSLQLEREEVQARQAALRGELQVTAEEQARQEEEISRVADLARGLRAQLDQLGEDLLEAQSRSSALEERTRSVEGEHARLLAGIEETRLRLARMVDQRAAWSAEQQCLVGEGEEVQKRLGVIQAEQQADRGRLSELEQQAQVARGRIREIAPLIESARAGLDQLREKRSETEVALARAQSDLSHGAQQCREELKTEPAALLAELPSEQALSGEALEAAERELAELKGRLESLGPVNMMALEELQEAEDRYGFLETQRQDLFASIEDTTQAIREIDQVSRQQFLEAFTAINGYFAESFRTLFGGGSGQLRLTDESDPESGIDMAAQPPGKRLQNVLLLSGGEKALAALALLIAMFRYTPSPFCILDEVDAPLDESNVDRFTRLIREMSRHTQFVLITHNKRTMEIACVLYGVTMQEPGVSKLVSVRFEDVAA